jgi:hypothetical protein
MGSPGRWPTGLQAGLLEAEPGDALRAPAGPARTQTGPAAPAGGPQPGQPGAIGQQLGYTAGARNRDDRPIPPPGNASHSRGLAVAGSSAMLPTT